MTINIININMFVRYSVVWKLPHSDYMVESLLQVANRQGNIEGQNPTSSQCLKEQVLRDDLQYLCRRFETASDDITTGEGRLHRGKN